MLKKCIVMNMSSQLQFFPNIKKYMSFILRPSKVDSEESAETAALQQE